MVSSPRSGVLSAFVLALVATSVAGVLHLPRMMRPFERSVASSAMTPLVIAQRNFDQVGFGALRGVPTVGTAGCDARSRQPLLARPPLPFWMTHAARRLMGWNEAAFRLVPYLSFLLAVFCVVLLGARFSGSAAAGLIGGLLLAVLPFIFEFGLMPGGPALTLAALALTLAAWLRARERCTPGGLLLAALAMATAVQTGFEALVLPPALLFAEGLRRREERFCGGALWILGAAILSLGLIVAFAAWGLETPLLDAAREIGVAVAREARQGFDGSLPELLGRQILLAAEFLGWPLVALEAVLLILLAAKPRKLRKTVVLLPATLHLAALALLSIFGPASLHGPRPWSLLVLGVVLAFAGCFQAAWKRAPMLAVLLLVFPVFSAAALGSLTFESRTADTRNRDLGALIAAFSRPGDLVMTPESDAAAGFYAGVPVLEHVSHPAVIEAALHLRSEGRASFQRILVYMPESVLAENRPLAEWLRSRATESRIGDVLIWVLEP